jgi:hypothetical protein
MTPKAKSSPLKPFTIVMIRHGERFFFDPQPLLLFSAL